MDTSTCTACQGRLRERDTDIKSPLLPACLSAPTSFRAAPGAVGLVCQWGAAHKSLHTTNLALASSKHIGSYNGLDRATQVDDFDHSSPTAMRKQAPEPQCSWASAHTCRMVEDVESQTSLLRPAHVFSRLRHTLPHSYCARPTPAVSKPMCDKGPGTSVNRKGILLTGECARCQRSSAHCIE